ncbi:hypothetical protein MX572_24235 (plasmid) [Rhodococcus pyridinivorans]|uniref:hypothetical protein n=1 Tax=Rhodococcus pyridinivorans TaxID=103816 RepID=UPI0020C5DA07|nr:hypothetical protein [Rhodococcus pyridinivorans]UTM40037.1 hypothetical protein MX572_24235 [Rhodococcus pyridinivorans]
MARQMFTDEELARLRKFPEVSREESQLLRLTGPELSPRTATVPPRGGLLSD